MHLEIVVIEPHLRLSVQELGRSIDRSWEGSEDNNLPIYIFKSIDVSIAAKPCKTIAIDTIFVEFARDQVLIVMRHGALTIWGRLDLHASAGSESGGGASSWGLDFRGSGEDQEQGQKWNYLVH